MSAKRPVGAHLSSAGGMEKAVERALGIGATALQVFSGSPRGWARPELEPAKIAAASATARAAGVWPIVIHSLYLINLTADREDLRQKSVEAVVFDLAMANAGGWLGTVVHLGSHLGKGWEAVREQLVVDLRAILNQHSGSAKLLIENSAGQNGKLASNLSEIRWLMDQVDDDRLGWCYDTCHGWAAGYSAQNKDDKINLFSVVEDLNLTKSLALLHVNDSRDPFASGRDRHANIGQGTMGEEELRAILQHEAWRQVPIITEAPGLDDNGPDVWNLAQIRTLTGM